MGKYSKESTLRSGNLNVGEEGGGEREKPNFQVGFRIFQKIMTYFQVEF